MARKDEATAETGPNFSIYRKELTITPALEPRQIKSLRRAISSNGGGLTDVIGLSRGFGEKAERSTLLRFGNEDAAESAGGLVKGFIGGEN